MVPKEMHGWRQDEAGHALLPSGQVTGACHEVPNCSGGTFVVLASLCAQAEHVVEVIGLVLCP